MPENLFDAGAGLLLCALGCAVLRLIVFVIALIARIRWKVPAADLQRLMEASFPHPPTSTLSLPRRRLNGRQQASDQNEAA